MAQIISMIRFYGMPSWFLTIGPDETRSVLVGRVSSFGHKTSKGRTNSTAEYWPEDVRRERLMNSSI